MKNILLKRPLFYAILLSVAVAVFCFYTNIRVIIALGCAFLFSFVIAIFVKTSYRKVLSVTCVLSLAITISFVLYYYLYCAPTFKYENTTVMAECFVVSKENDDYVLFCKNTKDGQSLNFFVKTELDKTVEPSSKISANLSFYSNGLHSSDGIRLSAYCQDITVMDGYSKISPLYWYYKIRLSVDKFLTFDNVKASAFLKGMMIGDKSQIPGVFENQFKTLGLSHILSVSGLHLMLAVLLFDFIFAFFGLHYKVRSYISIVLAFAFTLISGFAVSCVRAFVMLLLFYLARAIGKFPDSLTSLAVSTYLLLLLAPYNIINISFVLSVLATLGLLVLTPVLNRIFVVKINNRFWNFILRFIRNTFTVCLAVNIACMPIFIFVFKQISLFAPVSNLLLILPVQIMFYLGFGLLAFSKISFISKILTLLISSLYNFIEYIVEKLYAFKFITVNDGNPFFYIVFALLTVLVIAICLLYSKNRLKHIFSFIGIYACLCVLFFIISFISSHDKLRADFPSVGHGTSSVFSRNESAVIIDCGGEDITSLLDVLRKRNIKNIEVLAITHLDNDHTNFISYLINYYKIDKIIYPEFVDPAEMQKILSLLDGTDTKTDALTQDCEFSVLKDAKVEVFVAKAYDSKITDNSSALYKFSYADNTFCITGDMGIHQEYVYLDYGESLDCDVLLVSHHGSSTSSYKNILDLYSPKYSIISASSSRKYGVPDDRIIERLKGYSPVLFTYDYNNISFSLDRKGYKLLFE